MGATGFFGNGDSFLTDMSRACSRSTVKDDPGSLVSADGACD